MRTTGFGLWLHTDRGTELYNENENGLFSFSLSEQQDNGITIIKGSITAYTDIRPAWLDVMIPVGLEGLSYHANGYQSWSESPFIDKNRKIRKLSGVAGSMFRLRNFGDYDFCKRASESGNAWSHLYIDLMHDGETNIFMGDLKPYDSYTTFSTDYSADIVTAGNDLDGMVIKAGETAKVFKICICPDIETWFGLLGLKRLPAERLTGWTSWYNYYTDITEYILEANMKSIREADIPIDAFQIDDGYFTSVGDWLEPNDNFPGGMKAMADLIKDYGWIPGLWSAPFVCDNKSSVFNENSGWIMRKPDGKLQPAGWNQNWTGVFYALDIYAEGLREYLAEVYETTVNEWGYGLLKLDFLYAAGLRPREGKTRAMVMADAMDFLLDVTKGAKILACGAPVGPAMGKCHYCRIGNDISHGWEDRFLKAINYRERVSTASSVGNTNSRHLLNGNAFLNDPDVFILRDTKEIKMDAAEKKKLFETNIGKSGLIFFSDDVSMYEDEQLDLVRAAFGDYRGDGSEGSGE